MHISVISDIKDIFSRLDHTVDDQTLSDHSGIMGKDKADIGIDFNAELKSAMEDKIWDKFYKLKPGLKKYDAFIVDYPPAFVLLYKSYKKPIILNVAIRYEYPWSNDAKRWKEFNKHLRGLYKDGLLIPVANNAYDRDYFEGFTGIPCRYIPSLCAYPNITHSPHPIKTNIIHWCRGRFLDIEKRYLSVRSWKKINRGSYSWGALSRLDAIIHFPYNCSIMSLCEQYTMGVPILVPSVDLLECLYTSDKDVMREYSWNRLYRYPSYSAIKFNGDIDPNNYRSKISRRHWWLKSDFYNKKWFPDIAEFDTMHELKDLEKKRFRNISKSMAEKKDMRDREIILMWQEVLTGVKK